MPIATSAPVVDELANQISSLLTLTQTGKSDVERKNAADELAQKVSKVAGIQKGFSAYGILDNLRTAFADKKNANNRESTFLAVTSFATSIGLPALPHLISFIPLALEGNGDKQKPVARAAQNALKAIFDTLTPVPFGLKAVLPYLIDGLTTEKCWQGKVAVLNALQTFAKTAPAQVDRALPEIIPAVSNCMWESKPEVQKAAARTLSAVCATVTNPDLHPFIPQLVKTIEVPSEVPETVYKLAATTFVTTVEAPSLAIMAPILGRGLNESAQAILRQTAVIIDNMCKLVEDPVHAEQFLPKLLPGLNRIIAVAADPELRNVATKAKNTLVRVGGGNENIVLEDYTVKTRRQLDATVVALKHIINQISKDAAFDAATLDFIGLLCLALDEVRNYDDAAWAKLSPIIEAFVTPAQAAEIYSVINAHFVDINNKRGQKAVEFDPEEGEELCNCEFSLAYGGMILLNNTRLRLTRGQRYGLCGPNGAGKSTLMRAIANGQLDGFPTADVLKTVFVEHNLQASDAEKAVLEFVVTDEAFKGKDQKKIIETLESVGFDKEKQEMPVAALSGGWKMKLELARAMLMEADILLLDEPTNHLDVSNVAWLTKYLQSLKHVTSIVVSHDSGFLDDICTHIVHYEYRKLKTYKGNLSKFVEVKPEAKSYYSLTSTPISFKFPEPGFLEGIKSKDRAILKMMKAGFQYPNTTRPQIQNISIQCSLNSRVAVLGPNGAGKSTLIKVLTGEVEATSGDVWKHPNLRVAYVAQHAFHHVEQHMDKTPNEYIRWRFQNGEDRELAAKITRQLTPEEEKRLEVPIVIDGEKRKIETIMGRRAAKKGYEYEIKWIGKPWDDNTWMARVKLEDMGLEKFLKIYDDKEAAREGLYQRPLTSVNVQKHLADIGLEAEFSTHSRIRGLSGGQKVKVVLGACMWDNPHILVLDEPTNYLDRDSLGALAQAIKGFGGGVVMVSHHTEFTSALCLERWMIDAGICKVEGTSTPGGVAEKIEQKEETEKIDAFGNISKVKSTRTLSRKEQKAKERRKALKIKNGEPLSSDEEDD
jgi:elongation factor 3